MGYKCTCLPAYDFGEAWNGDDLDCQYRVCAYPGFDMDHSCGAHTRCIDLDFPNGIRCECADGFKGIGVDNNVTTCQELTCDDDGSCPLGSSCSDSGYHDGYACTCGPEYHFNESWNGAELTCNLRNCADPGFTPLNSCGPHTDCTDLSDEKGVQCSCEDGYDGETTENQPTRCVSTQCRDVDCGVGATCTTTDDIDGYVCVCDDEYLPNNKTNGNVTCTERRCDTSNTRGFDCGANTVCEDLSTGNGVMCSCESDACSGVSVMNGPATCLEKTCKDASCPSGSSCDDTGVDGYVCRCDDAYIPAEASNGADVSCIERTCEDPGLGNTTRAIIAVHMLHVLICMVADMV